ncbi:MAG: HAD hydrolase family protein [Acutalibacteraceae bacterium]|nr:HAD hydrolase family protein [Acutalibacteraceae bacterium]MEE1263955.1 HAD hydrolase family protein [Ruminococcus sp.]
MDIPKKLPPIGARIIKSSVAVALCMVIYFFRTLLPIGNGIPFYSALAALWCLQPYSNSTKNNAGQRSTGTFIGAAYGLAFIVLLRFFGLSEPIIVYLLASVIIIPVIYLTVITDNRNASFFSCVVFLSIALTHSFDENPYLFVLNRVLDTFIGIGVGLAVNNFHLPIKHDSETLYISGIDSVLIPDDHSANAFNKVELNRMIESGVKFTLSTIRTPAEVKSLMKGVNLKLPIIVMDGAAMYDLNKREYLEAEFLQADICEQAERIIAYHGMHCFVNVMYDATLLIFYGELWNTAEKDLYETHKHSPYRNYIRDIFRRHDASERVLYLTVLDEITKIANLEKQLVHELGALARITVTDSEYDGYQYLKVFSSAASKKHMLVKLKSHTGCDNVVTIGSIEGKYDVYIGDGGGNATIKKLKKLYRNDIYH